MIGLIGLYTEIKTPGWGMPGTIGVISLALFFGSGYILELASALEIILFIVGLILLLIEIFVIPGFGVFGVSGIALMIVSLFLGLISDFPLIDWDIISVAIIQLALTLLSTLVIMALMLKYLPKTSVVTKLVLDKKVEQKSGYGTLPSLKDLVGREGIAYTDLRPSGTALIDGKRVDVISEGDYIQRDSPIIVKAVEGLKVIVERKK
ncbi:MAG: NfeD family protein [Melioribacter sp.]|uniref:NfeD family protein n=1 Tax=Melioribacter sp. TaxID=2052167 RepID=UPI003BE29595